MNRPQIVSILRLSKALCELCQWYPKRVLDDRPDPSDVLIGYILKIDFVEFYRDPTTHYYCQQIDYKSLGWNHWHIGDELFDILCQFVTENDYDVLGTENACLEIKTKLRFRYDQYRATAHKFPPPIPEEA